MVTMEPFRVIKVCTQNVGFRKDSTEVVVEPRQPLEVTISCELSVETLMRLANDIYNKPLRYPFAKSDEVVNKVTIVKPLNIKQAGAKDQVCITIY